MKTLILCRHGKSDWPSGVSDMHRPLKERGISEVTFLSGLLADQGFCPDLMISSPARRAIETAQIVKKTLTFDQDIRIVPALYEDGVAELIHVIHKLNDQVESVMIFGHNPTMEHALTYLLEASSAFEMPTSAMACIEMRSWHWKDLSSRNIHLRWLLVPRLKRKNE